MKHYWLVFVGLTILCWGAYVPTLHHGQSALVGSVFTLVYLMMTKAEPMAFTGKGASLSTFAGLLGAVGALGIVFALKNGGSPMYVAPLVFAGAPIINTLVAMIWSRPARPPGAIFYVGLLMAAAGAALVLRFRPT
jgi:hypothetical protein